MTDNDHNVTEAAKQGWPPTRVPGITDPPQPTTVQRMEAEHDEIWRKAEKAGVFPRRIDSLPRARICPPPPSFDSEQPWFDARAEESRIARRNRRIAYWCLCLGLGVVAYALVSP
jgi:hypothetical protein